jgi:hypothetical protein
MRFRILAAAAFASAALLAGIGSAGAAVTSNAITSNALVSNALVGQGSAIANLNGVTVESVTPPRPADKGPSLLEALQGVEVCCECDEPHNCCPCR